MVAGTYKAIVREVKFVCVGDKQTPSMNIKFQVGMNIETMRDANSTIYSDQWINSDENVARVQAMLTKVFDWVGVDIFECDIIGKECLLVIEEDEYNGRMIPKVKWINGISGGSRKNESDMPDSIKDKIRQMSRNAAVQSKSKPEQNYGADSLF